MVMVRKKMLDLVVEFEVGARVAVQEVGGHV